MDLRKALNTYFGYDQFRPGQEDVVRHIVDGKDTIAILPTGMGKSLCYQLPAYLKKGAVLIISPLVALMEDQVAIMKKNGEKRVVALNSFLSFSDKKQIMEQLYRYKFIFISPEMLAQPYVGKKLGELELCCITIDEAHCISQWGFDFRPDYLRLGDFFSSLPKRPPVLALTATANGRVTKDIARYLQLTQPAIIRQSIDRPNILYSIVPLDSEIEKTDWLRIRLRESVGPGIIYVASRKRADELSLELRNANRAIASYHAGKEPEDRAFIQEQFINGELDWICATNAFGMGIHKEDIRQVIHEHLPQSISGYVQEVGRAGRDGKDSAATLLYAEEDGQRIRFIIEEDLPHASEVRLYAQLLSEGMAPEEAANQAGLSETGKRVIDFYLEQLSVDEVNARMDALRHEKILELQKMIRLVHSEVCIREKLLSFFDENCEMKPKSCCSVCGRVDDGWIWDTVANSTKKEWVGWEERLAGLLGSRSVDPENGS
ncbi:ATP-dependent DNA helicase RecQ [Sporosarcina sp. 179-K 3D1 HS]|uniref:RecQ family ATP-dependent DNA helicase n=1 Tax=Sporosarcina sp. 179-K 3D1 HS TaxID=3232169 RepID=UPI0039A22845